MLSFKHFPVSALPYESIDLATKLVVKFYEKCPYLVSLPNIENETNILQRTFANIPGVNIKSKKVVFVDNKKVQEDLILLDEAYINPSLEKLEHFNFSSVYYERFLLALKRIQPNEAVVKFVGPLTSMQIMRAQNYESLFLDKFFRKLIIQTIVVKVNWIIQKIKSISPKTRPIIVLEESMLNKINLIIKENSNIDKDLFIGVLKKVIFKIQEAGGFVCVQSFEKCDWSIPIEAGTNMISFDAYNNPNNLCVIAPMLNDFCENGGYINWGIIPTASENCIKNLTINQLSNKLEICFNDLVDFGVNRNVLRKFSTISTQGDMNHLSIIFAEKAIILGEKLSRMIATI